MSQEELFEKDVLIASQMNQGAEDDWIIPTEFPDLTQYKQIAIDLETCDPNLTTLGPGWARKDGYIVGIALAAGDWYGYFPIRHANGQNLDARITMKWLRMQMATPHIDKVMHNATYDLGWLLAEGVEVQGRIIDTMITGAVVDENRFSYSLNNLGRHYIGMTKNEKMLRLAAAEWGIDPKAEMYKLPPKFVGTYAEQDAVMTLKLWEFYRTELEKQDLWNIWKLETSLIPMMVQMRQMGVRVDLDKADQARTLLKGKTKDLRAEIKRLSGVAVEPWAAASVAKVFEAMDLKYTTTDAGAPTFTKQFLSMHQHPIAQMIVKLREFDKADSTFIDTIMKHSHQGRINTEFHQLRSDDGGTVTGRFCVSPDTLVETQRGPVPIVDIKPKTDYALTHLGRLRPIKHLIYKGEEKMVEVVASSGVSIKCTENHRLLTPEGWVSVKHLKPGSGVYHVDQQAGSSERGTVQTCGVSVSVQGQTNVEGLGKAFVSDVSHGSGDGSTRVRSGNPEGGAGTALLEVEDRVSERNVRKEELSSSKLQGEASLRSGRICPDPQAGLVYWPSGFEVCIRAPGGDGSTPGSDGCSGRDVGASHRRGQDQQYTRELSTGDGCSPSKAPCVVSITEIKPLGVTQVWDIEVEEDHSYVAHGLIHHNSCSNPNLQQIPARDPEIKGLIRGLFIPEDGTRWGSFDYSSQEPRLLVHFAAAVNPEDVAVNRLLSEYKAGGGDLHQTVADMAGITRKQAKTVNLGIMYGMGGAKLANQLDISVEEAKDLISQHREKVPFVKNLAEMASNRASRNGQIRTLLGRLCRFDKWEPRSFGYNKPLPHDEAQKEYGPMIRRAFTYKALNKLIQGSAADQTKKAMADCFAEGLIPMLTVHDELCFSVESDEQAARITDIMENGLADVLNVPSKVDQELGNNWGEVG